MGAADGRKRGAFFRAADENKVGKLQRIRADDSAQHRSRQKPPECLEYIVVHEMAHLLEPTHNARFVALMDQFMPKWDSCRSALNRLPVRHENWGY